MEFDFSSKPSNGTSSNIVSFGWDNPDENDNVTIKDAEYKERAVNGETQKSIIITFTRGGNSALKAYFDEYVEGVTKVFPFKGNGQNPPETLQDAQMRVKKEKAKRVQDILMTYFTVEQLQSNLANKSGKEAMQTAVAMLKKSDHNGFKAYLKVIPKFVANKNKCYGQISHDSFFIQRMEEGKPCRLKFSNYDIKVSKRELDKQYSNTGVQETDRQQVVQESNEQPMISL